MSGDLPALLVDPRDDTGRAVRGMWLAMGDAHHTTTSYRQLVWPTGPGSIAASAAASASSPGGAGGATSAGPGAPGPTAWPNEQF